MLKNINLCNNCGKQGHLFHQCKLPITSYGIIAFRFNNIKEEKEEQNNKKDIQFLMIRRKDSFGYIDFIRGKYSPYNIYQIQNIVNEMSISEKTRILNEPFDKLWRQMWGNVSNMQYKNEELSSSKKMDIIRNGVLINDEFITLKDIIDNSTTSWTETEWEFPKGRRNHKEKDLECALREFEEESGIPKQKISVIENILPFEEIFIGTNHKSYKHKYFLAFMNDSEEKLQNYQVTEVSKIEWKSIDECLESIRSYNLEKKQLITNIYKVLQEYRLYTHYISI
jgi:8-oxo-dGTP pyrophosphatase MutT (NUDIX family)